MFILAALLFVLFLGLKLAEVGAVADWSWVAVTSPLWVYGIWTVFWIIVSLVIAAFGASKVRRF